MKTLEMFNDFLSDTLAETADASASDIGSLIALAFLEGSGDTDAIFDALQRITKAFHNRPAVQNSLEVVNGVIDQIKLGEW